MTQKAPADAIHWSSVKSTNHWPAQERETLTPIDDRQDGESPRLTLSNFYCLEERGSGDLLVYYPRLFANHVAGENVNFAADLLETRISLSS